MITMRKTRLLAGLLLASSLALPLAAQEAPDSQQLIELAGRGELTAVAELLAQGADPRSADRDGTTLLHWAVYYDDAALVRSLIEAGAEVATRNDYHASPLSQAAILANPEIIGLLLEAGADPDERGADNQTPLMIVARSSQVEAAKLLLEAGADPNAVEQWRGQTALMWAAAQKQPQMVQLLLEAGADPDAQSTRNDWERQVTAEPRMKILPSGGLTPLLYAAREGCSECTRLLVEAGADLNKPDPDGISPLLMATLNAKWDSAKVLVEAGANLDKWDVYGRNPLYATVDYNTVPHGGRADRLSSDLTGSLELIALLLDKGANPNLQLKLFPPYRALGADRGADGMLRTGATPLFRAARGGDVAAMELLLQHGALPDLPTEEGITPLMAAAGFRASAIDTRGRFRSETEAYATSKLLLETAKVDVNHVDRRAGQSALFGAASQGYSTVVQLLAEHGADLELKDSFGNSPLDAALGRAGGNARDAGGVQHVDTAALIEKLLAEKNAQAVLQ